MQYLVNLNSVNLSHIETVGGKNASIGEMIQHLASLGVKLSKRYPRLKSPISRR